MTETSSSAPGVAPSACGASCGCGAPAAAPTTLPVGAPVGLPVGSPVPMRRPDAARARRGDAGAALRCSLFAVPQMDCPSEENLIRLALQGQDAVQQLHFDLPGRRLRIWHHGEPDALRARLEPLQLGARWLETGDATGALAPPAPDAAADAQAQAGQRRLLWTLLALNGAMFLLEGLLGWWAESTGLIADALDMLADAAVYGLALAAVGRSPAGQLRAAHLSGWLQLGLALGVLVEVGRRLLGGSEPEPAWMAGVGALALAVNLVCLWLVLRQRDEAAHMRASAIFTANDVLANLGVLLAAALVAWTGAAWPDLLIGTAIAALVAFGAWRILRLR